MFDKNQTDWEQMASVTPDVFTLPTIAPQGEDGVAHFNYFDPERILSFQWNGRLGQHVTVSHGGYGEPVKWTFNFGEVWSKINAANLPLVNYDFWAACYFFKQVCDEWIRDSELKWLGV